MTKTNQKLEEKQIMATKYSLTVQNNSKNYGNICIFQTIPDQPQNMLSLAWFSKAAHPDTVVEFSWYTQYNFVWSDQGELKPGITFKASQVLEADPSDITKNSIGFIKEYDAYRFTETSKSTKEGNLGIYTNQSVPHGEASLGIGMSGNGTFVVTATPNYNFIFQPHPRYWVAFGTYKVGEVMDIESMSNIVEVKYDPDVFNKCVTLKSDNTWSIDK